MHSPAPSICCYSLPERVLGLTCACLTSFLEPRSKMRCLLTRFGHLVTTGGELRDLAASFDFGNRQVLSLARRKASSTVRFSSEQMLTGCWFISEVYERIRWFSFSCEWGQMPPWGKLKRSLELLKSCLRRIVCLCRPRNFWSLIQSVIPQW